MKSVSKWFDRGRLHTSSSTQSLDSLAESQNLESALRAVELIMDDDLEGAEKGLAHGNSAFHQLCKGVIGFIKAALGFEQEIMREASQQLSAAENSAYNNLYRAQKNTSAFQSNIYDKGAEFALCQAEAQIMSAVVAVLNESLTESLKGFYKLRKAYIALDGLIQMENTFIKARGVQSLASSMPQSSESVQSTQSAGVASAASKQPQIPIPHNSQDEGPAAHTSSLRQTESAEKDMNDKSDDSEEFYEADDIHDENPVTKKYEGNLERPIELPTTTEKISHPSISHKTPPGSSSSPTTKPDKSYDLLTADPSDPIFSSSLDIFIHSGTNLCFGLLSLMISAIPPAFSKLLYVIGFRGDRERGMRMLWQASKFSNINGGLAGLIILGWYNALVGFCDIIPDTDHSDPEQIEGYPAKRLEALLAEMRQRYPKSHLWLIEEARMTASRRDLNATLALLSQPGRKSQLKQLEALHMFEKSISAMAAHRYQLCADSIIACVDLNSWSHALYYYIAGAAHLTMYRDLKTELVAQSSSRSKEDIAKDLSKHAKLAEEYFKTAPTKSGKKKMMGRQLPFDTFVNRKIAKWTARSEAWSCDFIDAVGVSPIEEMILLWNGYNKMNSEQLEVSLQNLAWSESRSNPHWPREELDEHAILALLRAVVYRNLRQHEKAQGILKSEILCHGAHAFKGLHRDDWTAPTAHYEMAVNLWMQRAEYIRQHGHATVDPDSTGPAEEDGPADLVGDAKLVHEAKGWVDKAKGWDKYELDARMGMKVTAALNAITKWEEAHGASGPK